MRTYPVHLLSALTVCAASAGLVSSVKVVNNYDPGGKNGIERVVPYTSETSQNIFGKIYTIDGRNMTSYSHYTETEDSINSPVYDDEGNKIYKRTKVEKRERTDDAYDLYIPTDTAYASIVGMKNCGGLLDSAHGVLAADGLDVNKMYSEGDHIITTIHSAAQLEAMNQLSQFRDYYNDLVGVSFDLGNGETVEISDHTIASMTVVSADGAILVSAGTNSFEAMDYINDIDSYYQDSSYTYDEHLDYSTFINYPLEYADLTGSSFKPVTARVLEQNNSALSEGFSIYEPFADSSPFLYNGKPYYNHEGKHDERYITLAEAFEYSSNLYFMRHAIDLGPKKFCQELDRIFLLGKSVETDVSFLEPLSFDSPETIAYGQGARLSPVHLATLYNTLLFSGDYYRPFMICEVRDPEYGLIYHVNSDDNKMHLFDVKNDENGSNIIADGLKGTFRNYIAQGNNYIPGIPEEILLSGRFLAKSGTADKIDDNVINRTMVVSVTNEEQNEIICTGVIAIDTLDNTHYLNGETTDYILVKALLETMSKLEGVI